jgi:large subunit ribosomal protein L21
MPDTTAYAVIKTGGKQYRVAEGQTLLVERLAGDEGATVELTPLLLAGGDDGPKFGDAIGSAVVTATIVGHERGPKIRVFKYKPKRGYKRRQGHRQELTRIRVDKIGS